jgi:hypothetical protein
MTDVACPALSDLLASNPSGAVVDHASGCLRCAALVCSTETRVDLPIAESQPAGHQGDTGNPGTVALVAADGTDELLPVVVLAMCGEALTVAPVSAAPEFATEWDLLLPVPTLGYASVAQVWNLGQVLPEQLEEVLGELQPSTFEALQAVARAAAASAEPPASVAVGAPVVADQDPRLFAQDEFAESMAVFWEPALALAGAATLGEVVRHLRHGLESEFAAPWLEALERDALDLPRAVPSRSLADLMRDLGVGASQRLREIARATIEAHSPAVARAAKGQNTAAENERYLDDFMSALTDEP